MNSSSVVDVSVSVEHLPFEPTSGFAKSVESFAAERGVRRLSNLDACFRVTPKCFFQRVAFGDARGQKTTFFGTGFHFQDGDSWFSFFVPTFEAFIEEKFPKIG